MESNLDYKKTYSDKEKMGKLKFEILNVIALSPKVIQLQGKFNLTRSIEMLLVLPLIG